MLHILLYIQLDSCWIDVHIFVRQCVEISKRPPPFLKLSSKLKIIVYHFIQWLTRISPIQIMWPKCSRPCPLHAKNNIYYEGFLLIDSYILFVFYRQLNVARTVKLLQLYSASSDDLIFNYYSERFKHQLDQQRPSGTETNVYPIGSINIRAIVHETHLRVEVLNARHLKPLETQKGQKADPAFKVRLKPIF